MFNKRGQIWIETMIYTLIAFSMIALVLAFAKPKIEEFQDKAVIDQSVSMLEEIDSIILTIVQGGPGNVRVPKLLIKKGKIIIDADKDEVAFEIESRHMYSQLNEEVDIGGMYAKTEKIGKYYRVRIASRYPNLDIKYAGADAPKDINKASTRQLLTIKNEGEDIAWGGDCTQRSPPPPGSSYIPYPERCETDPTPPGGTWIPSGCLLDPNGLTEDDGAIQQPLYKCRYKSPKITINMEL